MRKTVFAVLSLAAAASAGLTEASAQAAAARSAPITNVHYDVTFDSRKARTRSLGVAMSFDVAGAAPVLLSLPAWTMGSYEIYNFAQNVMGFAADQGGRAVRWEKRDHDTWQIAPAGSGRLTVRFDYLADSLDNAASWTRPDFALFNGTNVFMYPEGRGFNWPATVTVHTERDWLVVTGMEPRAAARTFGERNYHDLVDMPFLVGRVEVDSTIVSGKWMRLATYPIGLVSGALRQRVWSQLQAMTPPQVAVFDDVPWRTYTVMQIADSSFGGASGLEHQNSHVDIVGTRTASNPALASLYSHEIFHAWNVKRLRPAEMVPYRYDAPQPTNLLWVSEGITDYYGDIAMLRGGLADSAEFLATTETKIRNVAALPATSMEDASLQTWVRPRDGTHYIYYDAGSLAGLLLDVMIRDATDNRESLDGVMRGLYNAAWKQGRGFTDAEWWRAVSRAGGGRSFDEFRRRYVDGREPLPYVAVLPLAGIRVHADSVRQVRMGVATAPDSGGVRVIQVQPGSSAAGAGVQAGDYLIAVGDLRVTEDIGAQFRERFGAAAPGTPIIYRVKRGDAEIELRGEVQSIVATTFRLSADPNASEKARRVRSGIFRGVVGR